MHSMGNKLRKILLLTFILSEVMMKYRWTNEGYFQYLFFDLVLEGGETMNIHAEQPGAVVALA